MKMSNAAWKSATAPIDPPLELNNHVNRIEPRTTDMNHPPAPARPKFDRQELKENNGTVQGVIQRLPDKLNRIISTATYGGWFNFYLCGLNITKDDGHGGRQTIGTSFVNSAPRCKL